MSNSTIRVVARVIALPDKVAELSIILQELVTQTRLESGCLSYQLLKNTDDLCDFTFIEEWLTDAAIDTHLQSLHVQAAFQKAAHLLAKQPDIRRYQVLY